MGAAERVEEVVGRTGAHHRLLGPLRRALDRSASVLDLLPAAAPLLPKVLGECAMLVHAAAPLRGTDVTLADAVDRLARRVAAGTRTPATAYRILLEPAHALDHASAHLLLTDAGWPDPSFHRHVVAAVDPRPRRAGPERLPHRELEQRWLGHLLGLPDDEHGEILLAGSALGRPLDALGATRLDAYAFTHCLMYAHHLGHRRPALPRPAPEVFADAEAALALAVDTADLDLAAELLMTWPLLGAALPPAAGHVLEVVLDAETRHGFLPGLGFDAAHDEVTALLANYHPATVMGILAALLLRVGTTPAASAPARPGTVDALARAWPGSPPAWVDDRRRAAPAGLAPLALTAGLRRAVEGADLAAVRSLLAVALEHDLAHGPAVEAATALLVRVSRDAASRRGATATTPRAPLPRR